ncbi:unnamed protein product [Rotaria socialis]|uniref:CCHC-type domain-containing protein n=1 Tax=Rotaria socialis TaxID=392032 RepID=A0A821UNT6_9BILA|nr:unnamed protein product [Rotaria socialis]
MPGDSAGSVMENRLMQLLERMALNDSNKVNFKVPKPGVFDLDDAKPLVDYFVTFEKYCAIKYGSADKDTWSPVLEKFLKGDIKNAYDTMGGSGLPFEEMKRKQFIDITKGDSESLDTFSLRLEKLSRKAFPKYEPLAFKQTLTDKFMACLSKDLRKAVRAATVREDFNQITYEQLVVLTIKIDLDTEIVKVENVKINVVEAVTPIVEVEAVSRSNSTNVSLRPNGAINKIVCSHCKRERHLVDQCWLLHPELQPQRGARGGVNGNNFNTSNRTCFTCNQLGHMARDCPLNARANNNANNQVSRATVPPTNVGNNNMMCIACGANGADFHLLKDCSMMKAWFGTANQRGPPRANVAAIGKPTVDNSLN